jgi:hypothetical protein
MRKVSAVALFVLLISAPAFAASDDGISPDLRRRDRPNIIAIAKTALATIRAFYEIAIPIPGPKP